MSLKKVNMNVPQKGQHECPSGHFVCPSKRSTMYFLKKVKLLFVPQKGLFVPQEDQAVISQIVMMNASQRDQHECPMKRS